MSRKHRQRLHHMDGEAPPNSPLEEATVGCPWCRGRVVLSYPEGHRCPPAPPPKSRQVFGVGPASGIGLDIGAAGWRRPGR